MVKYIQGDYMTNLNQELKEKCIELKNIEKEIREIEKVLRKKRDHHKELTESIIPDIMKVEGQDSIQLDDHTRVDLENNYSLPYATEIQRARGEKQLQLAERKYDGMEWLAENGGKDLMQHHISINFFYDQDEECESFTRELDDRNIFYKKSTEVYHHKMKGFLLNCERQGIKIPRFPFLGNSHNRKAVLK